MIELSFQASDLSNLMSASELTNRKERVQVRENVGFPIRTRPKDCAKKINFDLTPSVGVKFPIFAVSFNGLCIINYAETY